MSKKFTGITSAGSAIPVYDKDAHEALQNKADVSALTAYQPVGDYYSASNPSGFLTAVPADMATTGDIAELAQSISETYQPKGDYQSAGDYYSASNPSGFITGVDLTPYQTVEGMTAYQPAGSYLSANALDDVSGAWNEVSAKLDTTAFSEVSGSFLTAHQDLSDYATKTDVESAVSGKADTDSLTAFQTVEGMTAYQPVGEYYSASNPSGFITGVDLTPYQTVEGMTAYQPVGEYYSASNPSGFITGVDLSPYQTIEGMSAYQPSGDYASASDIPELMAMSAGEGISISEVDNTIVIETSGLQPSGNYLTAVPETYLQNTDLSTADGKITAISGIPLSAGGDVPEGVMATSGLEFDDQDRISGYAGSAFAGGGDVPEGVMTESGLEYNAANEISGYNGSAISQYGAEKQWLTHDDTLVHLSNSAQYALGVNLSGISADLARLLSVDETLLWSGDMNTTATSGTLSESLENFKQAKIITVGDSTDRAGIVTMLEPRFGNSNYTLMYFPNYTIAGGNTTQNVIYLQAFKDKSMKLLAGSKWVNGTFTQSITAYNFSITAIYGIGRKN